MDSGPSRSSIMKPNVVASAAPLYASFDPSTMPEFDFDQATYLFEGSGYKVSHDHTAFIFKVTAPNGVAF